MATFSGKDGKVMIGATPLAEITKWEYTRSSNNPAYASSATQGWKTRRGGVKDATGSLEGKLDPALPITNSFDEGSSVTLLLHEDGTRFHTVPAIIDSIAWSCDINDGDVLGFVAQFSLTGPPTKPTYA